MRITKMHTEYDENREIRLVKESGVNYGIEKLSSAETIARLMVEVFHLDKATEEHVYLIAVNTQLKCRGIFEISKGTVNQSLISTREVMRNLLLADAVNFFLVHNHPSGDANPSDEDKAVTEKLLNAAALLDLTFLDHVIVSSERTYVSFNESGLM